MSKDFEVEASVTAHKMKFSIKNFFSKYDQIWSHLLKKSFMENFAFCAVSGIPIREISSNCL